MYARAWLSSTLGMSREVKGAYIDLLCWEWDNGPLPHSSAGRARIFGAAHTKDAVRIWSALRAKFTRTARGWINKRLEAQREELAAHRAKAKVAAEARWDGPNSNRASSEHRSSMPRASSEHAPSMSATHAQPMLNGCTPTPTPKRTYNRRTAPVQPPFKVIAAIAARAFAEEPTDDLGAVAERMKRLCAQQNKACSADMMGRALRAVEVARAKNART
jgi:uncharacterized protein YdaU (DUF1376 family)